MNTNEIVERITKIAFDAVDRLVAEIQELRAENEALRAQIARMRAEWTRQTLTGAAIDPDAPVDHMIEETE